MLSVEKVYDELYGMIEDLKKKIASISAGDEVTITPALDSGTKIADFTIGENEGTLYTPTIPTVAGLLNYSTDEQELGITWLDGRPLYIKSYNVGALPNATIKEIATLTVEEVRQYFGSAANSAEGSIDSRPLPFSDPSALNNNIRVDVTLSKLRVVTGSDWSTYNGTVTIIYTKSTDTPPETKTRKKK